MTHKIDIPTWNRKEHYRFFSAMELPYQGFTAMVDCSKTYRECKAKQVSFFALYLHKILEVIQSVDALKLRIVNNEVFLFDTIHGSATVLREDETFGYSYLPFTESFRDFAAQVKTEKQRIQSGTGLQIDPKSIGPDMVYFTVLPWFQFTQLDHARGLKPNFGIPQIAIGKMTVENGKYSFPVSIHVHHGLADGLDVGKFYQKLQEIL